MGALGTGAPVKIIVSSIYVPCVTPTSIALSCSARTDGTETDRFFFFFANKLLQFVVVFFDSRQVYY